VVTVANSTAATSSGNGAVVVAGGIGVGANSYFGASVFVDGTAITLSSGGNVTAKQCKGTNGTNATSTSTGDLVATGGVGCGSDFFGGGNVIIDTAGKGLQIKANGSNCKMGTATLSSGSVTVSTTAVTASSYIYLTHTGSSTAALGVLYPASVSAGTSFAIKSSNGSDADTVNWLLVEPAP
jgi:hypothetical protein